jgi:beta-lactamase class A
MLRLKSFRLSPLVFSAILGVLGNIIMIDRRQMLVGSTVLATLALSQGCKAATPSRPDISAALSKMETGAARLGVCILDSATGEYSGNRIEEHFAMCSTFKMALAAIFLREADAGRINLTETLPYSAADIVANSQVTQENLTKGSMTIAALAEATQKTSDNTAANLLIKRMGGPAAVTAKFPEMGDNVTRIDRYEPEMNFTLAADLRDTTTPLAYAQLTARLLTGNLLKPESRALLLQWMVDTKTGMKRLRAGLPADWRAGDKTGTGAGKGTTNKYNDVAIVFPPGKAPVIIAAYYDSAEASEKMEDRHQAVLAEAGRIAAKWMTG